MSATLTHLPRAARPFVRFVIGADFDCIHLLAGPFRSPCRPDADEDDVPEWYREPLNELLVWFNKSLAVPPFRRRGFSRTAVCWFRSDAGHTLQRMWELAILLRQIEVPVRFVRTHEPGRIIYSDDHQIVADRRWQRRPRRTQRAN
jgi:hypothetical protein